MNLLKKILTFGSGCLFAFGLMTSKAKADDLELLNQAIIVAEKRFAEAEQALKTANSELYNHFVFRRWSEEFQNAEKILRTQYSKEYYEYIEAKMKLDDLLEIKNMVNFNKVSNK